MMKNSRVQRNLPTVAANASVPVVHILEIGEQIGTFGPEAAWKIYEATRRDDHEAVSLFVFEKRTAEKLHKPKRKGTITELYKRGFKQLERVQHPRFLKTIHSIEETPDALMVITEPVIGSLSDVVTRAKGNLGLSGLTDILPESTLLDLEIKCGIVQITEALIHLHSTEHSMHGNVCPDTILVAANGSWKLAGLEFVEKSHNRVDSFPSIRWSSKYPKLGQPNLNFIAPEVQLDSYCSTTSDMFSLGMTICAIYNQGRSLLEGEHSSSVYEQQLETLTTRLREFMTQMPTYLQEAVENLLHRDPRQRPTAQLFSMTKYFNDPALTCLRRLDYLDQMFPSQKAEFYPALRDALHSVPRKLWMCRVLPALTKDLRNHDFPPYAIYPLSYMIEHSDKLDYMELFRPRIQHVFDTPDLPLETQIILLRNLSSFAKVAQPDEVHNDLIPVLEVALQSVNSDVLDAGVQCFAKFYPVIRDDATKFQLFQSLKSLFHKRTDYSLKVLGAIVVSLDKILDHLSKALVLDEVLPTLAEEQLSYTADSVMALVDFYRHLSKDSRFALNPEHISKFILPSLLPSMISADLTKDQYLLLDTFIKETLSTVEKAQRSRYKLEPCPFTTTLNKLDHHHPQPHPTSASNSRRGSMNEGIGMKTFNTNGGPHIVFTAGDNSAPSSRSSSPTRSIRRASYAPPPHGPASDGGSGAPGRSRSGSAYLHVEESAGGNRSRTSPATPERRSSSSFLGLNNPAGLSVALSPTQRRHSAVSIQSISSQMVSLFAGRTS